MQPTQNPVTHPVATPTVSPSEAAIQRLTPARVLRAAAGYLHQFGWFQGDLFDDPEQPTPCACPIGAIRMSVIGVRDIVAGQPRPDVLAAFDAAVAVLADYLISGYGQPAMAAPYGVLFRGDLEQVVAVWNDDPNRNVGQVIAALNGAADEWDRIQARRDSCGCLPGECSDECCVSGTCTCMPERHRTGADPGHGKSSGTSAVPVCCDRQMVAHPTSPSASVFPGCPVEVTRVYQCPTCRGWRNVEVIDEAEKARLFVLAWNGGDGQ